MKTEEYVPTAVIHKEFPPLKAEMEDPLIRSQEQPYLDYKYNEGCLLRELEEYIDATYSQHYSKDEEVQTFELIKKDLERGFHFCQGNIIKYADRCKEKGQLRKDLLKVLHYGILALHCHDEMENKQKTT